MKTILILGSSRKDGNSSIISNYIKDTYSVEIIDLNDYSIGYFDYDNAHENDDFLPLIKHILTFDHIIFLSPVYWYSMSAIMKTFFDRITDLMKWHKDLGRQFRGKRMSVMSNGYKEMDPDSFFPPFEKSSLYLGMNYGGSIHTFSTDGVIPDLVKERIESIVSIKN